MRRSALFVSCVCVLACRGGGSPSQTQPETASGSAPAPHEAPPKARRGPEVAAVAAPLKLPGRCESLPSPDEAGVIAELDLDGDGTTDVILDAGADMDRTDYEVYVRRGDCAHDLGSLTVFESNHVMDDVDGPDNNTSTTFHAADTRHHGLADIVSSDHAVWRFDGKHYAPKG
jgi:hypothetical protein